MEKKRAEMKGTMMVEKMDLMRDDGCCEG